jgi:uncharacterized protein (DUF433 family)
MTKTRIVSDPNILGGKPIISGTRISVELIMNFLAAGMNIKDILKEYPELKESEVLTAVEYATKLVSKQNLIGRQQTTVTLHEISR